MAREPLTGLPGPVERRLVARYGRSAGGRIGLAAAVKALTVLLKRHPRAAIDMAAAAAVKASRVGVQGMTERIERLGHGDEAEPKRLEAEAPRRRSLSRRERRRFLRLLREGQPNLPEM